MELTKYPVNGATTPVTICPIGDIQWAGHKGDIAYDHFQEHIQRCLSLPNPLFIGMGDYGDFASPSNREAFRQGRFYDTAQRVVEDKALDLIIDVYQLFLKPTKGKWLGLLHGHHYFPLKSGGTTDMRLAAMLDAPFLGDCAVVTLQFGGKDRKYPSGTGSVKIWAHHGCGDSVFPHGPLNKLYRVAPNWNVDIMLMGHQTKKAIGEYDQIDVVHPSKGASRLDHKTRHLVGTGGWSKGYQPKRASYVEKGMLPPVALGQPIIHIKPRYRRSQSAGVELWEPNITVEA